MRSIPRPTASSPWGAFVGDRAYGRLLAQLAAADPVDAAYARLMAAVQRHSVTWDRQMRVLGERYEDAMYSGAARAARQAAEARYAEGDALAELATSLEARPDDPVDVDLRHDSNVPAPIRKAASCTQLELVA